MQFPRANRDLLIEAPSIIRLPFDFSLASLEVLSDPAKSAIDNLE